jgi:Family of unknown function (DUF5684)
MDTNDAGAGAMVGGGIAIFLFVFAIFAVMAASMWKVFAKAGQPGWAALVPVYNIVVLLKIVDKPLWWIALFCLPGANLYAMVKIMFGLAKSFGKGTGFGLGLLFLGFIFFPMLGFGSAQYAGLPVPAEQPTPEPVAV